jgi:hypothetical protein
MPVNRWLLTLLLVGAVPQRALAQSPPATPAPAPIADDRPKAADAAGASPTADDLAKPADATVPADAAPAPPRKPSSDDIDLSSLGLDPSVAPFDDKLNVYGFADIGFLADHWTKDLPGLANNTKSFLVGNFNLYVAKNLTEKARLLGEVRFTLLPNGSQNADGSLVDTTSTDLTNYGRPSQWGGVVIERLYIEYDIVPQLSIRAGRWLTPFGIWNIDHGSPVIISVGRPYVMGENFFPERQTGIDLFGSRRLDGFKLGYHATVSNGRSATEAQSDPDSRFAFGGRLELETPWGLRLGGSYYRGRYTGLAAMPGAEPETYLEAGVAGDAMYDHGGLHLQAEVVSRDRHYLDRTGGRDTGWYVLAGYRFDRLWNVMPFAFYNEEHPADHTFQTDVYDSDVGLNFRPAPSLVFKVMGSYTIFRSGDAYLSGERLYELAAQASCAF